jgi:translation initiation factor IF-2
LTVQEFRLQEKIRIYALARELNVEWKDLLDVCRQAGFDVKNQLSSLDADQRDLVAQMLKRGGSGVAVAAPPKATAPVIPQVMTPVRQLHTARPKREPEVARSAPAAVVPQEQIAPSATPESAEATPPEETGRQVTAPAAKVADQPTVRGPKVAGAAPSSTKQAEMAYTPSPLSAKVRDLSQPKTEGGQRPRAVRPTSRPSAVVRIAKPPTLKPSPKDDKRAQEPTAQKPLMKLSPEMLKAPGIKPEDLINRAGAPGAAAPPVEIEDDDDTARGGKARPGQVTGREKRHQQRNERAKQRRDRQDADVRGGRVILPIEDERPQQTKQRLHKLKRRPQGPTQPRKGRIPVEIPITVRALSEAVGIKSGDLLFRLQEHGVNNVNINSTVDAELATLVALDVGCELEIKKPPDAEDSLLAELQKPDDIDQLRPRAPIVTIMGHVDHGKTTLLDKIRQSNVAATEAGGITQVIRAWRVEHQGKPITFLDTPGHQAFTKMRARGAQVTDIAVIVDAADDGVMPQTEEAINHAKAAGVPIVVAINKIDLPNANINRTRQQLYALGIIPDNMGGDAPFVEMSAAKGQGIDLLLETLSLLADLRELKANPEKAARGICLEAMLSEGQGVLATLLVRDGTLRQGDVLVCGAAYGRVRAMYDDLGRPCEVAGPSVPVRITGLDQVPNADDGFLVVPELALAREIAEKRKAKQLEASQAKREPIRLENLSEAKIAELKVILKADFRGSIEAIRKELEKFQHAEVRVRILHTGIGAITESDVTLALTSPEDTLIVGFNVVPDDRAKALADERGVQVREYNIIYNLTDDIKSALEGKLKPEEKIVYLGRAVVRQIFKISRVGTIAGCFVTEGTVERSAKVRLIRQGVVIYPPRDRNAGLDSLKRFKDDVREVSKGFECGLKIAGYDDIKVDDVVEAFRIEQEKRTL